MKGHPIDSPSILSPEIIPPESLLHEAIGIWKLFESPLSFMVFSFLTALGAAVGKSVFYNWGNGRQSFPIINLFLLGPSGLGKSTSLNWIRELIDSLPPSIIRPLIIGPATKEKLVQFLQIKSNLLLIASEFASAFPQSKYLQNLLPFLVEMLDYPSSYHHLGAKKDGNGAGVTIENPQVILASGSTVDWLYSASAEAAVTGGFIPRHIAIFEDKKSRKIILPKRLLGPDGLAKLEARKQELFRNFQKCVEFHSGEIDLNPEAEEVFCKWAENYEPESPALAAFGERSREFTMRLAILLALSCREHSISAEVMKAAINLYEYSQARLSEVVIPLTLPGKLHKQILAFIEKNPEGVTRVEVRSLMLNTLTANDTDKIVTSLLACEKIQERDGKLFKVTKFNPKEKK